MHSINKKISDSRTYIQKGNRRRTAPRAHNVPFAALPHLYTRHIWNTDSNTLRDQNDVRQKTGQTFRLARTLILITDIERQASI